MPALTGAGRGGQRLAPALTAVAVTTGHGGGAATALSPSASCPGRREARPSAAEIRPRSSAFHVHFCYNVTYVYFKYCLFIHVNIFPDQNNTYL